MVNYEKIVSELKKGNGLSLFVVAQMDELVDTWTIIFAADWVDDKSLQDTYLKISKLIDENGSKNDVDRVSRVSIFQTNHYLIKGLLEHSKEKNLKDVRVNGNTIHNGIIYYPR